MNISKKEYSDLLKSEKALHWLEKQGVCWRDCDKVFTYWNVGPETEWHYGHNGEIRDLIEEHIKRLKQ
tara:strand:+ start:2735 stop:2938 length:204 start_codon:yes stop_codon:yes gene_type:complete